MFERGILCIQGRGEEHRPVDYLESVVGSPMGAGGGRTSGQDLLGIAKMIVSRLAQENRHVFDGGWKREVGAHYLYVILLSIQLPIRICRACIFGRSTEVFIAVKRFRSFVGKE